MNRLFKPWLNWMLAIAFTLPGAAWSTPATPQGRPRRLSERPPQPIPPNSHTLPKETVLILRMETRLHSGSSHASDRFTARLNEAVVDSAGRTLIPSGALVTGHLTSVMPAQLRRRSGVIEVGFDKLRMIDGRELPLAAMLTSPDENERQQLIKDGHLKGGSAAGRNTAFVGGSTAVGAVIGAIAGGALVGAGIGAAAGATAVYLSKGKEAVVEPGTLIGMQLMEALDLDQGLKAVPPVAAEGSSNLPPKQTPSPLPTPNEPIPVRVTLAQAERLPDGSILVLITTETRSAGWQVKSNYAVNQDLLEIWVRGTAPEGRAAQVISHPTLTLTVFDAGKAIHRVMVHGANGDRLLIPGQPNGKPPGARTQTFQ